MHRRDALRRCASLSATAGLALLAGCAGGGDSEPPEVLSVTGFDYRAGDSGDLVVAVTVENAGDSERTGYLYVTVEVAEPTGEPTGEARTDGNATDERGDATTTAVGIADEDDTVAARESLEVTVPAGETRTVEVPFEFAVERYERDGSIDVDLRQ